MIKKIIKIILYSLIIIALVCNFYFDIKTVKELNEGLNSLKETITDLFQKPDFEELKSITVQVKIGKAGGAGILIKETEKYLYISTAQHITRRKGKVSVWLLDINGKFVKIIDIDRKNIFEDKILDLALIRILKPKAQFNYVNFAKNSPVVGTKIYSIGHPLMFRYTFNEGIVTNYTKRISCTKKEAVYLQISAPSIGGNSGGALINEKNELVGMVIGIMYIDKGIFKGQILLPHISFAVKIEDIKRFLKEIDNETVNSN